MTDTYIYKLLANMTSYC